MLKLGEYEQDEARDIADILKGVGIRVELRPCISTRVDHDMWLEGRLSELKEESDVMENYERHLEALKEALEEGASPEDIEDRILRKINPDWNDEWGELSDSFIEWLSLPDDRKDEMPEDGMNYITSMVMASFVEEFVESTLSLNEITIGEDVGERLDDPILRVDVDMEDYPPDHKLARVKSSVNFEKSMDVYIDEFDSPLVEDSDEVFREDFPNEYFIISVLGMMIDDLLEAPESSRKIDMDEFRDLCEFEVDFSGNILEVDAWEVADDIAKVLEKRGIVKIKGDQVKWKRLGDGRKGRR
jgi:hypothetical protein